MRRQVGKFAATTHKRSPSPALAPKGVNQLPEACSTKGAYCATRNDRTGPHGCQHGAPASQGRPSVRGLRPLAASCGGSRQGKGGRRLVARRPREEAGQAARPLADGPGGGGGQNDR